MSDLISSNNHQLVEKKEKNEVVTNLDEEAQLKLEVIQTLLEPCGQPSAGTA